MVSQSLRIENIRRVAYPVKHQLETELLAPMKILMLTHTYHPSVGGGIRYKKAVVDHLRSRGHQVDVLALNAGGEAKQEVQDGGRIFRATPQIGTPLSPISFSYLLEYGRRVSEYDVLLFNFPSPMEELGQLLHRRRSSRARKVVMYHADIVDAKRFSGVYNRFVTAPFLGTMDAIIVSSPRVRDLSRHLMPHKDRVHVIPFGIDLSEYARPEPMPAKNDANDVRILFVGRMSRYKGIDVLLRAFQSIPGGRLRLVGDGPLRKEMEALAEELAIQDRVDFLGRVSDEQLINEYHDADVFVLPSTDAGEAFGYVLIEAMAGRNAIVSTELNTGTSYVNEHGKTGVVVRPGDVGDLRDALRMLVDDHDRRFEMQEAAHERALEHFTIERMLRQNEAVITGSPE